MQAHTNTLQERLALLMARDGVSTAQLARVAQVSTVAASKWVNGKTRRMDPETAVIVANFFGVTADWLNYGRGSSDPTDDAVVRILRDNLDYSLTGMIPAFRVLLHVLEDAKRRIEINTPTEPTAPAARKKPTR